MPGHVNALDADLQERLEALRAGSLLRELRRVDSPPGVRLHVGGRALLNFSSNDYLGLATHPALQEAAARAVRDFGAGAAASRLICGSLAPLHELEEALAAFKGTAAAVGFSSGYAAALGTIPALVGPEDIVILDRLVHASIIDAARLSGARLRVFKHNDLEDLARILQWADRARSAAVRPRVLIVTESVFSMDGDRAPLRELVALKERHGAWLMVDEAHATGVFGENRRGLIEEEGVEGRVEIQMGTLGKAVGAAGGFICGSRALADFLINRARSLVFSTAPVPAQVAAARAGVELIQSDEGARRCQRLWSLVDVLRRDLPGAGWSAPAARSAIVPLRVGAEARAMEISARLREQGILLPPIRYPTVARGAARLRVTLSAAHTEEEVRQLVGALAAVAPTPA
jgi:8-amino-7-oxononanoate synthase